MRSIKRTLLPTLLTLTLLALPAAGADKAAGKKDKEAGKSPRQTGEVWSGLELRPIGPALTSGRISDIVVDPTRPATWYVAVASGGVWKTTNAGTTWTPIFDNEGSYSIGCLALDPKNPLVVWVGTGESNGQRSVSYGDGVYRSEDGGKSWTRMGLEKSEHVGRILVDPRDSSTVFVAAQGPLWSPGGDRGLYKTTDGGKTWKAVLTVSENTGVTDVVFDPADPDTLYAAAWQRRRHVWTMINGGPESAIYRSTDGGATWAKVTTGLPREDIGRIGLAVAPTRPGTVYAVVEAANGASGFFRSADRGLTWEKRGSYTPGGPMYYQQITVDPADPERIYSMDVFLMVSDDGGKSFRRLGETSKHVDNHVIWVDPRNTEHYLVGGDGGLYESFDAGASWDWSANLPVTQFYRVAVDDSSPIYRVYGGTQDSFSLGGPSRTLTTHGVTNREWEVFGTGDGFQPRVDPTDPNIVYSMAQHGYLRRFDRRTGEDVTIQPQTGKGEPPLRWNWDSPLLVSPHSPTRLYFGANRVFRTDDRGQSWRAVSEDLTRQIDRNKLPVMGKIWSVNAVARHASTSFYGNIVALDESPRVEGLLYVGTDDGLIQVSEDAGRSWRRVERFPGVPENAYVSRLNASFHDDGTVYAAFDHHKMGDFKPYVLRSTDRGRTWTSIAGDLPERGTVYALVEDPDAPGLLFAGTEFGLFFTRDGGKRWVRLRGGLPTIQVRDLAIQRREKDLVVGTFGRGIYILDDYTPLRHGTPEALEREAALFPVRTAWLYSPSSPLGYRGKSFQGDSLYTAPNPPFGAVFTYHLKEEIQTRRKARQAKEKETGKEGGTVAIPTLDEMRAEAAEVAPALVFTITDESGQVVRRLTAPTTAGVQRVAWDLRWPPADPADLTPPTVDPADPYIPIPAGPLVAPGTYRVALAKSVDGRETPLGEPQAFEVRPPVTGPLSTGDRAALQEFVRKVASLQRAAQGAERAVDEMEDRIEHLRVALRDTPAPVAGLAEQLLGLSGRLRAAKLELSGDEVLRRLNEPVPPSILDRIGAVVDSHWSTSSAATATSQEAYRIAAEDFESVLADLGKVRTDLESLEARVEAAGAPWTPGRLPEWKQE
ncbi:MAG TPA: glycosyl hydrolase [Thermoanaerobaculia bacterium]|nr:glycosyl hydrolase [Thermoanaerobaculia bacterium]